MYEIGSIPVIYGFLYLPSGIKSYENKKFTGDSDNVSVVPLVLFCSLRFFTIGTTMIIMTMLGELFPLKIRSIASGMTTAFVNVLTFGAIKTFYNFELLTSLPGAFCIYACLGSFGWVLQENAYLAWKLMWKSMWKINDFFFFTFFSSKIDDFCVSDWL